MKALADDELRVRQNSHDETWHTLVADHPLATPFHTLAWRDSITAAFGYDPAYALVTNGDGTAVGAVPGFHCPALPGTTTVNPFCEYGFPLLEASVPMTAVLSKLKSVGRFGARLLKDADWTGLTGYSDAGYGAVRTGHARRLPLGDFETVRNRQFDRNLRRNVEHAREAGVTVHRTEDVSEFYECYLTTMRRHGSPQFPRAFLAALVDTFGTDCQLLIAEYEGEPVAGLLGLDHGDERYLLLNGSEAETLEERPNDLLYWEAVRSACESGYDRIDFGRTAPGSGVRQFKRRFGGRREQLTTLVWPPHRVGRADVSGYRRLKPVVQGLSPLVTHPAVGPRVKGWIHE